MLGQHVRSVDLVVYLQVLVKVIKTAKAIAPLTLVAIVASVLRGTIRLRGDMTV